MELKHLLRRSLWAICLASAAGTLAQPGAIDSDGDEIYDHEPDLCPHTPGVRMNHGCPADLEVVVVYGTSQSHSSVVCPNGATPASYTGCAFFAGLSASGGSFVLAEHNAMTGTYSGSSTVVTVTSEEESEEDEVDWSEFDDNNNGTTPDEAEDLLRTPPGASARATGQRLHRKGHVPVRLRRSSWYRSGAR